MTSSVLLFLFCFLAILFSLFIITVRNPIHSILYLILVFCCVSLIFLTLGLEFTAIIFLIVYVGAIAVLFLFVVMMLNIKIIELDESFWRSIPVGLLIVISFFIFLIFLFLSSIFTFTEFDKIFFFGNSFDKQNGVLNNTLSSFSFTNSSLLGWVLYTYTFETFLIVSLLLLVAMVGSIVLVLNQNINVKRQVIFKQVGKSVSTSISLKSKQ